MPALPHRQACDDTHSCGNQPRVWKSERLSLNVVRYPNHEQQTINLESLQGRSPLRLTVDKDMEGTSSLARAS
jgi:hypothetical protein